MLILFPMNTGIYRLLTSNINLHTYFVLLRVYLQHTFLPNEHWSIVLLEKLIDSKLFKKFPAFDGTQRFITMFTFAPILNHMNPLNTISSYLRSNYSYSSLLCNIVSIPVDVEIPLHPYLMCISLIKGS